MNAESGTTVAPELPELPAETFGADEADPGEVAEIRAEQAERRDGKYGSTKVGSGSGSRSGGGGAPGETSAEEEDEKPTQTMTFELRDSNDDPIKSEPYEVRLPDGSTRTGRTGEDGSVKIDGVEDGDAEISFPRMQDGEWDQG